MTSELQSCQALVSSMRVPELQMILQTFDKQKLGRKQELVLRVQVMLKDPRYQPAVCQRIREVTRTGAPLPMMNRAYNSLASARTFSQQSSGVRPVNHNNYPYNYSGAPVPVIMPSRVGGRTEQMPISRLPFYDIVEVVLKMSEMQCLTGRTGDVRVIFPFSIPSEWLSLISYRTDHPTPRHEIQMRMFHLDYDIEQADDFPPNCNVRINDFLVTLPNIIPTNKPNAEQKRYSRPVDVTSALITRNAIARSQHRLEIDYFSDKRSWVVGIWLVHRQNASILLNRMLKDGVRRSVSDTKKRIKLMLDGDDDNIALDTLKISLLCPLMKTRMEVPARAKTCHHLQCFDLSNFLQMNEKRPSWKCPQCNSNAHYDNLVIDDYFMDLLENVEKNVQEVELLRDGNWKVLEVEAEMLSDDDDDVPHVTVEEKPKLPKKEEEVITLDSDDDEPRRPSASSSSSSATAAHMAKKQNGPHAGPPSKIARVDISSSSGTSSSASPSDSESDSSRRRKRPRVGGAPTASSSKSTEIEVIELSDDNDDDVSSTNGVSEPLAPPPLRTNGLRPDRTPRSQFVTSLSPSIEYDIAGGLARFVNSMFLRDQQSPHAFNTS